MVHLPQIWLNFLDFFNRLGGKEILWEKRNFGDCKMIFEQAVVEALQRQQTACMMLNINLDYDWIMGDGANYRTSIILNGRKQICHSHLGRRFLKRRPFFSRTH